MYKNVFRKYWKERDMSLKCSKIFSKNGNMCLNVNIYPTTANKLHYKKHIFLNKRLFGGNLLKVASRPPSGSWPPALKEGHTEFTVLSYCECVCAQALMFSGLSMNILKHLLWRCNFCKIVWFVGLDETKNCVFIWSLCDTPMGSY